MVGNTQCLEFACSMVKRCTPLQPRRESAMRAESATVRDLRRLLTQQQSCTSYKMVRDSLWKQPTLIRTSTTWTRIHQAPQPSGTLRCDFLSPAPTSPPAGGARVRTVMHTANSWKTQVGDVEAEVTDNFNFDVRTRRVTFVAQEGIWAIRFGTVGAYDKFVTQYNSHLFENTYGLDNDEANRTKVISIISLCGLFVPTGQGHNIEWPPQSSRPTHLCRCSARTRL